MFAATFFFLGIGGLFLLASLCLLDEKAAATSNSTRNWSQKPTWHKRAKWPEIKAAWTQWYVQCQKREAPQAENTAFVGTHDGVMCCNLHCGRLSQSGA